ncbi:Gfo/Idh/MocA family oxidoreductase [Paractinoplanes lichenicola]|uniref:Gfo/Idh/MocA family oxidoreductase n=1 Tax=Paractinoplanes lichenicola TaxID=2802976 RepID=A0ABS1VH35_9ACTN|nr:Gfo/Idh/MocA family oxidoreductase [Actinoplanes lichenicola]MBL7253918.1 Gfo/Idh/MocA family oxidoreductase [Actinoplanes lichenicola]
MTRGIGVVGVGNMGADHATTLQRYVSGARVVLVADLDVARAETVARELGCQATGDAAALIGDSEVEAVVVAAHDSTHAGLVRACVAAGKPVLCEKPLTPTYAESARLLDDLGDRAGLVRVGFMRRFDPGYAELRARIRAGAIGTPLIVHAVARTVGSYPGATTESMIGNSAVHDFDVLPWLLGSPIAEVSWQAPGRSAQPGGVQDPQLILLRTEGGTLLTVELFLNAGYGYDIRCEVVGPGGTLTLAEPVRVVTDSALARSRSYAADWRPRFADAYRLELQAWVDGDDDRLATARDGLVAGAVAEAVVRSMRNNGAWTRA